MNVLPVTWDFPLSYLMKGLEKHREDGKLDYVWVGIWILNLARKYLISWWFY